ncbi:Uncharacterised protein [Legionella steigerwaltii]|uniref:Uncharacterized protein n=1 Tax=Legionella steigerwaltii TaxID=460 RepID=A0A378LAH4_9GAMM|nr:hypothetical protein [Legionella steigerwaltii]KTD75347.1 hypothetical protein Lstg_2522 [Legionella steigerwaltii]STY23704.1 Uncharacterised protein [Legionella steigerwaltii]
MLHTEKAASGFKNDQNGKILGIFKPIKPDFLPLNLLNEPPHFKIETPKWIVRNTSELVDLLNDSNCSRSGLTTDLENLKIVKFLLTTQNELVFGPYGRSAPGNNIPAYAHLAVEGEEAKDFYSAECITSGVAWFTENNELIALTANSVEFRASFHSLQFALPHFLCIDLPISDSFRLSETDLSGRFLRWHFIERSTFEKYARENLGDKEDINSFSSLEKKEIEEQKTSLHLIFSFLETRNRSKDWNNINQPIHQKRKLHLFYEI